MDKILPILTADGSSSLLNQTLNETYHSTHGAIQESDHVFIKNGVQYFQEKRNQRSISVFEVGFGTGLNALLSLKFADAMKIDMGYTSIERNPISREITAQLNFVSVLRDESLSPLFLRIHECEWEEEIRISNHFALRKIKNDLSLLQLKPDAFDIIYFDAFAPSKQPEMWALPILEKVVQSMKPGGVFVTYCAKGQLKRDLKNIGLQIESLAGPPGKREMVRAVKSRSKF